MKFHKFDSLSFLVGLAITGLGLAFLIAPRRLDVFDLLRSAGNWFWPVVFIGIGIAVLAPLATRTNPDAVEAEDGDDQPTEDRKDP